MISIALRRCVQVFDALIPLRCALCGEHDADVCAACRSSLSERPLIQRGADGDAPAVVALGPYEAILRAAVLAVKFRNRQAAARSLGQILGAKLHSRIEAIVPVPLHERRLRLRGFNQAEAIGEGIGAIIGVPLALGAVTRVVHTGMQSARSWRQRQSNVAGAFAAGPRASTLRDRRVLIVDDVVTTGSTIASCAAALRAAGVMRLSAAALAIKL